MAENVYLLEKNTLKISMFVGLVTLLYVIIPSGLYTI